MVITKAPLRVKPQSVCHVSCVCAGAHVAADAGWRRLNSSRRDTLALCEVRGGGVLCVCMRVREKRGHCAGGSPLKTTHNCISPGCTLLKNTDQNKRKPCYAYACICVCVCVCVLSRYDLPAAVGPRSSGLSFGPLPAELYSLLASGVGGATLSSMAGFSSSSKTTKHKVSIVTGAFATGERMGRKHGKGRGRGSA